MSKLRPLAGPGCALAERTTCKQSVLAYKKANPNLIPYLPYGVRITLISLHFGVQPCRAQLSVERSDHENQSRPSTGMEGFDEGILRQEVLIKETSFLKCPCCRRMPLFSAGISLSEPNCLARGSTFSSSSCEIASPHRGSFVLVIS